MEERWAPLVYGRTYEVDYKLPAIPEDFSPEDRNWALQYITVTLREPDKLKNNPRWSLFKNERYLVIGVSCMFREIYRSPDKSGQPFPWATDKHKRPLYIFS